MIPVNNARFLQGHWIRKMVLFTFFPVMSSAHQAALDEKGGHYDSSTHSYHCHQQPCFTTWDNSNSALQEAQEERRHFSHLSQRSDWLHWLDEDHDCQDTRAEVLIRDSRIPVQFESASQCRAVSGECLDPYSGQLLTLASNIDIDHVVSLKWAHDHGGANWTKSQKAAFANDQANLLAVSDYINREKGALGPDQWLPSDELSRCLFLDRYTRVVRHYQLRFTDNEVNSISPMLFQCDIPTPEVYA